MSDRGRVRRDVAALTASGLLSCLAMGGAYWGLGIPVSDLTRDPATVSRSELYIGAVSNLGILLWGAAAFIGLAGGWWTGEGRGAFLALFGAISLLLGATDLLMLHEEVIPARLGIAENWVLGAYGALLLAFFWRFRGTIAAGDSHMLRLAMGFFVVSVLLDVIPPLFGDETDLDDIPAGLVEAHYFVEDGAKFVGIVAWLI